MKRFVAAGLLAVAALLLAASPVAAHAVLESSNPTRGAQLDQVPELVSFTFNEPVEASLGAVRVFDTNGNEVQESDLERPGDSADAIGASLPPGLPDGLYTATYRVVSADAHPISGGITFTVGEPGKDTVGFVQGKTISELLAETETGPVTEVAFWFDRWLGYLAIALMIGAIVWLSLIFRPGRELPDTAGTALIGRFRRLALPVAAVGLVASLLAIIFQGAIGSGSSFWHSFGSGIPGEVIETRYGTVMLIRAGAWAVLLGLVAFFAAGFRRPGAVAIIGLVAAVVLAVSPALGGHAATRDPGWLLIPSDVIHVGAMAVWTGGLAAMLWLLPAATRALSEPTARTELLLSTIRRFSTVALVSVLLIGVTGAIQSILEVGSVDALFDTQFGRAVAIKIVLFAVLVGLGAANRGKVIPAIARRMDQAQSPGRPGLSLRRNLRLETTLIVAVLGVTAALVSYPPPDAIQAGPASGSLEVEGKRVEYTVDPARVGSNEVHIYVFDDRTGAPVPVIGMDVTFSLPSADIAPIEADARKAGPGHFVVPSAMLGVKGDWLGSAAIRISRFEEPIAEFEVEIE